MLQHINRVWRHNVFFEKPNIEERDAQWECRGAPSSAAPTNEPARALYLHSSSHMRAVCTTEGALGVRGGPRLDYSRGVRWAPITHAKPHSTQTHPTSPSLHCYQPNSPLKGKCLQIIQHHSHASGAQQMGEHRGWHMGEDNRDGEKQTSRQGDLWSNLTQFNQWTKNL